MNRRRFLKTLAAGVLAPALPVVSEAARKKKTNVLFIAIDDLRGTLGCLGDKIAVTPNMDKLAGEGTVFLNAYCQQAVCNPSRASVITGRRPDTLKVWDLKTHFRAHHPDITTLPQYFKQRGYYTRSFGKILHGQGPPSIDPPSWSAEPVWDHCTKRDQYVLPENRPGEKSGKQAAAECADVPDGLEGTSMVPLLENPQRDWKKAAFTQFPRPAYYKKTFDVMGYALRTERFHYIEWIDVKKAKPVAIELYDHQSDPYELTNLAQQRGRQHVVEELGRRLKKGWKGAVPDGR